MSNPFARRDPAPTIINQAAPGPTPIPPPTMPIPDTASPEARRARAIGSIVGAASGIGGRASTILTSGRTRSAGTLASGGDYSASRLSGAV